jgi:tetratricopeptide (TPR) repeat protein
LGSPLTKRRKRSTLAWAGGVFALYIITGASVKVIYGYTHRGQLFPNDAAWFRRQFASYSPLPVASLFGPNFHRYLGYIPNSWRVMQDGETDTLGDTEQHHRDLNYIMDTAPDSIWAASAVELRARLGTRASAPVEERVANYRILSDRYGNSPYTAFALQQIARIYADAIPEDAKFEPKAREAYLALQTHFPGSAYSAEALRFLTENDRKQGDLPAAALHAQQWIEVAPVHEKFMAYLSLAEIYQQEGKTDEAKQAAQQAVDAVKAFRNAVRAGTSELTETRKLKMESEANGAETRAKALL